MRSFSVPSSRLDSGTINRLRDLVVCGMGWTETRLDYEDNPETICKVNQTDSLEIVDIHYFRCWHFSEVINLADDVRS
jgi:hypothetical protein